VSEGAIRRCEDRVNQLARELEETGRAHELFASLYVTLERLHRSLKVPDVVAAIHEVLINLVGTEDFALFVRDDESGRFQLLSAMGKGREIGEFVVGEGALGLAAAARELRWGDPRAVAPLLDDGGRCVGLIAIVGLLLHKPTLERRDQVVVETLAAHAGIALEAALAASAAASTGVAATWSAARLKQLLAGGRP
jgi:hypothetical protein